MTDGLKQQALVLQSGIKPQKIAFRTIGIDKTIKTGL